ncbi:hypothetical protein K254310026_13930 [Clostridium tetani]|nr:hypothetical protein K254310026_13930 [Clostridium tetani]BDR86805.1 hypothetical protein N071400001_14130 [Clostridium tetani]
MLIPILLVRTVGKNSNRSRIFKDKEGCIKIEF